MPRDPPMGVSKQKSDQYHRTRETEEERRSGWNALTANFAMGEGEKRETLNGPESRSGETKNPSRVRRKRQRKKGRKDRFGAVREPRSEGKKKAWVHFSAESYVIDTEYSQLEGKQLTGAGGEKKKVDESLAKNSEGGKICLQIGVKKGGGGGRTRHGKTC